MQSKWAIKFLQESKTVQFYIFQRRDQNILSPSTWINDEIDLKEVCTDFFGIHQDSAESRLQKDSPNNCNGGGEQFECVDGCIFSKYVCDGEKDCYGGEDEENCIQYVNLFEKETGFKVCIDLFIYRHITLVLLLHITIRLL